jgi:hypothetical protein
MTSLPASIFQFNSKLTELDLSFSTKLQFISSLAFVGQQKLLTLRMTDCNLSLLPATLFAPLKGLSTLFDMFIRLI